MTDKIIAEYSLEPISVRARDDGYIEIYQDYCDGNDPARIAITPDQVETVVEWLHKAREIVYEATIEGPDDKV